VAQKPSSGSRGGRAIGRGRKSPSLLIKKNIFFYQKVTFDVPLEVTF
jgi:hypothetical protein